MAALQQKEGSLLSQQLCMLFSAHLSLVVRAAEVLREMSVASLQQLIGGQAGLGHLQSKVKVATDPVGLFSALLAVTISSEDSDHTHNMATNLASVLFPSGTSQSFASSCVINVALAGLSPDMVNYFGILLLQRMTDVQQRVLLGLQIIGSHHSLHPDPTVEVCGGGAWVLAVQSYLVCLLYTPPMLYSVLYYSYMSVHGTVVYIVWYPASLAHLQHPLLTSSTPCSPPAPLAHLQHPLLTSSTPCSPPVPLAHLHTPCSPPVPLAHLHTPCSPPLPLAHLQYPLLTSSTPCSPPVPLAHLHTPCSPPLPLAHLQYPLLTSSTPCSPPVLVHLL